MTLDSRYLAQFIEKHEIHAEIVRLQQGTPTVADAAEAVGVSPEQIVKSVLFLVDHQPVLVVANGLARIDYKRLADHLGVSRRRIKLADQAQVLAITGYEAGAVPPFGHRQTLRTVIDTAVLAQSFVYGGGGENRCLMRLSATELQRVVGSENAPLIETTK